MGFQVNTYFFELLIQIQKRIIIINFFWQLNLRIRSEEKSFSNIRLFLQLTQRQEGRSYRMLSSPQKDLDVELYLATKYRIKPVNTHQTPIIAHNSSNLNQSSFQEDQQFFTFVRNGKYKQAYVLGQKIIKNRPYNNTVATFCQFLKRNFIEGQSQINKQIDEEQESNSESSKNESESSKNESEQSCQQSNQEEDQNNQVKQNDEVEINRNEDYKEELLLKSQTLGKIKQKICKKEEMTKPHIPKLALQNMGKTDKKEKKNQGKENNSKQLIKNIINIKLNQQSNHDRERRYRYAPLADNFNKKYVKLPWVKHNLHNVNPLREKQNVQNNFQPIVKQSRSKYSKTKEDVTVKQTIDQKQGDKGTDKSSHKSRDNFSFLQMKNKLQEKRNSANSINLKTRQSIKKLSIGFCHNRNEEH